MAFCTAIQNLALYAWNRKVGRGGSAATRLGPGWVALLVGLAAALAGCGGSSSKTSDTTPSGDTTPPAAVTNFTATPGDGQIVLAWSNPTDADFAGVAIRRATTAFPATVADGVEVYSGTGTTHTDTGLTNGTTYYYAAFTRDAVPNYSAAAQGSGTPTADLTPPAVASTTPASGAVAVLRNTTLTATFSEPVDASTVTATSFTVMAGSTPVAGAVTASGNTATFTATSSLPALRALTATLTTAVKDAAGNALAANHTWTFNTTSTAPGVPMLAGGGWHVLALHATGSLKAWGADFRGAVGVGTTTFADVASPQQVCAPGTTAGCTSFLTDVIAVAGGDEHSLALKSDGTVWAWGDNGSGQLGDGTGTDRVVPVQVCAPGQSAPCTQFLTGIVAISANYYASMALRSDGTVWTWGYGRDDVLGHPVDSCGAGCAWIPAQVLGPGGTGFLTGVTGIAMGAFDAHALKADGTLWGWGDNPYGELGNGDSTSQPYPVQAAAPAELTTLFTQVAALSAGSWHVLVLADDGTLWGIGDNVSGELGYGSGSTTVFKPVCAVGSTGTCTVAGANVLTDVTSVATGQDFAVASRSDGSVLAWGSNAMGTLGAGIAYPALSSRNRPAVVCAAYTAACDTPLTGVGSVAVTLYGAGFALLPNGTVQSWGTDYQEELARTGDDLCWPASGGVGTRPCDVTSAPIPGFSLRD